MKRREFLRAGGAVVGSAALGVNAQSQGLAGPQDITPLIREVTGGRKAERADIDIEIPQLAENGNSVPLHVRVKSPMSADDHVTAIHVFAERNPRPHVATFHLGPQSGRAELSTRIRLAGTQNVTILAALSGDRFRIGESQVLVTSAACLDETAG
jgi:sulfur-oxidizing protein SoxY